MNFGWKKGVRLIGGSGSPVELADEIDPIDLFETAGVARLHRGPLVRKHSPTRGFLFECGG